MKLLLVEDNPPDARLIHVHLDESPSVAVQLQHVTRLDAALELLGKESFDLVLLDLGLPDSQGMETLTRMHQAHGNLPIVILTGLADERFALEAMRAGAQDYLVKGRFDSQLLVRSVRYAAERKRAEEEIRRLNADLERRVEQRTAQLKEANEQLHASNQELQKFNRLMVGRELRMIELKKEINALCAEAGRQQRYETEFADVKR